MAQSDLKQQSRIYGQGVVRKSPPTYVVATRECIRTGGYVGCVRDLAGAYTQGETLEELNCNIKEVIALVKEEDVNPSIKITNEFVSEEEFHSID